MPLREFPRRSIRRAAAVCVLSALAAVPASAGGLYKEHIHADSFGNLVVYSPAGYKRIVVGKGYLADEMAAQDAPSGYPNGYLDDDKRHYEDYYVPPCKRQGVLLHGRSYMYGLPENVVPVLVAGCN